jgi:hypothetical protein
MSSSYQVTKYLLTINAPLILKVRDIICFAPDKKIISRTCKIRGALVFLCPRERERRERERERERESESESESKSEREKRKERGERREEREERREKRGERREKRE